MFLEIFFQSLALIVAFVVIGQLIGRWLRKSGQERNDG